MRKSINGRETNKFDAALPSVPDIDWPAPVDKIAKSYKADRSAWAKLAGEHDDAMEAIRAARRDDAKRYAEAVLAGDPIPEPTEPPLIEDARRIEVLLLQAAEKEKASARTLVAAIKTHEEAVNAVLAAHEHNNLAIVDEIEAQYIAVTKAFRDAAKRVGQASRAVKYLTKAGWAIPTVQGIAMPSIPQGLHSVIEQAKRKADRIANNGQPLADDETTTF
jgi:hypothetical protein